MTVDIFKLNGDERHNPRMFTCCHAIVFLCLLLLAVTAICAFAGPESIVEESREAVARLTGLPLAKVPTPQLMRLPGGLPSKSPHQLLKFIFGGDKVNYADANSKSLPLPTRIVADARTGRIVMALWSSPRRREKDTLVSIETARSSALEFAKKNYLCWSDKMVETEARLLDHGAAGVEYSFSWHEKEGQLHTGNLVMIGIDAGTGRVWQYFARYVTTSVKGKPKIDEKKAIEVLMRKVPEGIRDVAVNNSTLIAISPVKPDGYPVWDLDITYSVFSGSVVEKRRMLCIIDAVTGEVLYPRDKKDWGVNTKEEKR